jgi:uncharacterized protein YbjT (DUF2867 family)
VRDPARAGQLPLETQRVVGDLTRPDTLPDVVAGIDAIVFTHGTYGSSEAAEGIDYGAVRNVLVALGSRQVRIALMTTIGVTSRTSSSRSNNERHEWKRRGERLVRASGMPYTIVRPGWFDYNAADQHRLVLLQGDTRHAGDPSDGVVDRRQIAEVLVRSLASDAAVRKTFELVAERGPAPRTAEEFDALFAPLEADAPGALDAAQDLPNLPLDQEPERIRADLQRVRGAAPGAERVSQRRSS